MLCLGRDRTSHQGYPRYIRVLKLEASEMRTNGRGNAVMEPYSATTGLSVATWSTLTNGASSSRFLIYIHSLLSPITCFPAYPIPYRCCLLLNDIEQQ